MVVSSEILFAKVRNQLHVAPKTMNRSFSGVKKYIFNIKLADLLLNINAPSLLGERLFKQISFHF